MVIDFLSLTKITLVISCATARNFSACLMHNQGVLELLKHFCRSRLGIS